MKPLDGILVLTLEQAVAAPLCSCRLADAGARVIKVERAEGDFARGYDSVIHGESAYFVWLNRGKESVMLNLKDPEDFQLVLRILEQADVLVQNFKPGALERMGLDLEELRCRHPKLITCNISGFGEIGPFRDRKSYDLLIQAESGLASVTGTPEAPGRVGVSIGDIATGMVAYEAVLEALIARGISGQGRDIAVSIFDVLTDFMTVPLMHYDYGGKAPKRMGLRHPSVAPYGVYTTQDGMPLLISIQNEREWRQFCKVVLQQPELGEDERFCTNIVRVRNRPELEALIAAVFAICTREEMIARLLESDTAYGELNDMAKLSTHPHLRRVRVDTPSGPANIPAPPALVNGETPVLLGVPDLGAHTTQVRQEFGGKA